MANVKKYKRDGIWCGWQAQWHYIDAEGERRQQTKLFKKGEKAKADRHAEQMAEQVERRGIVDPNKFTVRSYLDYWVANHPKRASMSPTTLAGYREKIDMACRYIGDLPLAKLGALQIDHMYSAMLEKGGVTQKKNEDGTRNQRPLTARTVYNCHAVLRSAFRQAAKWNLLPEAPTARATPPQPERSKAQALSKPEFGAVRAASSRAAVRAASKQKRSYPGMDVLVDVLGLLGGRRSETLGLATDDINHATGQISVQRAVLAVRTPEGKKVVVRDKNKTATSTRKISVPAGLLARLKAHEIFIKATALAYGPDYQREPLLLFPEAGGRPMDPDALTSKMRSLMRSCKIDKKGYQPVHGLRHTMASHAFAAGVDLVTVQHRLGHSKASTTSDIYLHMIGDNAAEDAAERIERALTGSDD